MNIEDNQRYTCDGWLIVQWLVIDKKNERNDGRMILVKNQLNVPFNLFILYYPSKCNKAYNLFCIYFCQIFRIFCHFLTSRSCNIRTLARSNLFNILTTDNKLRQVSFRDTKKEASERVNDIQVLQANQQVLLQFSLNTFL